MSHCWFFKNSYETNLFVFLTSFGFILISSLGMWFFFYYFIFELGWVKIFNLSWYNFTILIMHITWEIGSVNKFCAEYFNEFWYISILHTVFQIKTSWTQLVYIKILILRGDYILVPCIWWSSFWLLNLHTKLSSINLFQVSCMFSLLPLFYLFIYIYTHTHRVCLNFIVNFQKRGKKILCIQISLKVIEYFF